MLGLCHRQLIPEPVNDCQASTLPLLVWKASSVVQLICARIMQNPDG